MQTLLAFDQSLFLFLNRLPHGWLANALGLLLSGVGTAGIIWFILSIVLFIREEKKNHWFFLPVFLAGAGSWIIAEKLLKPWVNRPRPTAEIGAIILGTNGHDASFPSGHATIAFAMAVVLSHIEPKWKWIFYLLALGISFSRIYLGKHFPLDVVVGGLLGWGIGYISLFISRHFKMLRRKRVT